MTVSEKERLNLFVLEHKEEIARKLFETFLDILNSYQEGNGEKISFEYEEKKEESIDVDEIITKILLDIGMPRNLKGFHYLRLAISICVREANMKFCCVTKELYPRVAKELNSTTSRVERGMRHAIEVAWDRGSIEVIEKMFGNTVSPTKGRPTVSEFIFLISDKILMKCNVN